MPQEAEPVDEDSPMSPIHPPQRGGDGVEELSTTPRWDTHQTRKKRSECETNDDRNSSKQRLKCGSCCVRQFLLVKFQILIGHISHIIYLLLQYIVCMYYYLK